MVMVDQRLGQGNDIFCLGPEKTDGFDVFPNRFLA